MGASAGMAWNAQPADGQVRIVILEPYKSFGKNISRKVWPEGGLPIVIHRIPHVRTASVCFLGVRIGLLPCVLCSFFLSVLFACAAPGTIWGGMTLGMSVAGARKLHPELSAPLVPIVRNGFLRYVMPGPVIGPCLSAVDVNFLDGRLASVEVHALTDTDLGDARICAEDWGGAVRQKYGAPLFDVRSSALESITWNTSAFSVTTRIRAVNSIVVYSLSYQAPRRTASEML